jgi:hypothetical protein
MSQQHLSRIRRLRTRRERLDREFRQAIVDARRGGATLAVIGRAAGLSPARIHGIVEEEGDRVGPDSDDGPTQPTG